MQGEGSRVPVKRRPRSTNPVAPKYVLLKLGAGEVASSIWKKRRVPVEKNLRLVSSSKAGGGHSPHFCGFVFSNRHHCSFDVNKFQAKFDDNS